jgi:nonsense-mediated mRNA decay protein 3
VFEYFAPSFRLEFVNHPISTINMDVDTPIALPQAAAATQGATQVMLFDSVEYVLTPCRILCCNCGVPIDGTQAAGALCNDCIKLTVDIAEGIQREATLHTCRDCERWLQPPAHWLTAAPESRELLALCLRKLRGLSKVRIIDANFVWTEPHSRRIKIKITIQQEALQGAILQQTFEVEYYVGYQQCPDCAKSFTANVWRACVQVRQKVPHKRTFLYLEQLILKHLAHRDAINIRESHDGLDFFFSARNHAEKFVDFLNSVTPVRTKKSQELISMDIHTSSKSYKFSYSCELVPICKDDLLALPLKLARQMGNISPMTICYRVGTSVNVLDPNTLQTADLSAPIYWRAPFSSLADVKELVEFVVMDIELTGDQNGKFRLADVTVVRSSDLGANDTTYFTRTHLGGILNVGDEVMGYHLTKANFNNPNFEALEQSNTYASRIPDVVLIKKVYTRRKKNKGRNWRLKRMNPQENDAQGKRQEQEQLEQDFEMFLRDVEEDAELRSTLALYKKQASKTRMEGIETASTADTEGAGEEDVPAVDVSELLEDFDDLDIEDEE